MNYIYSAVFSPKEFGNGYFASVPDLPGCISSGKTLSEAIEQITDAAAVWLCAQEDCGEPIPQPSEQSSLRLGAEDLCSLVRCDTIAYRAATDTHCVRKNVSLPAWMVNMADRKGINCSQVLQEALVQRFGT